MSGLNLPEPSRQTPLLQMVEISKEFPGCLANDDISFSIQSGQIHALLGENGAGKSTLVNIIYGVLQASRGQLIWQGQAANIRSPAVARAMGIAMVFQHFSLFDSLTVKENIELGLTSAQSASLTERIVTVSTRYGIPLDPGRFVYTLSVGERQRIEIVRCLLQEPKLLIMDEPTSVLTPQEIERLFETLRQLTREGVSILYISHKLEEIRALCDEASILRGGRLVATANPLQESARSLAALMMGQDLGTASGQTVEFGEVKLSVTKLNTPDKSSFTVPLSNTNLSNIHLSNINLHVRAGEILGIAGVAGNGQDELMSLISGEEKAADGSSIVLLGQPVGLLNAALRRRLGLCCVPEERLGHAAVPDMTLSENGFLTGHHRMALSRAGFLAPKKSARFARDIIKKFHVQCRNEASPAASLSGGNLQKFVVGREIMQAPDVLVVAQPTWGVDAGAALAIHEALIALAAGGSAIVVISQDLDELMLLSHTLMALCAGNCSAAYPAKELSIEQIGLLMAGMSLQQNAHQTA